MLYPLILADPPWRFASNSQEKPGRNAMRHYPCMRDHEIAAIKVPAATPSMLFMWTTAPMLARSLPVMEAWGFRYVSQLVWIKSRIATGFWVRNRHEILLIGKRGAFPCPKPAPFADSVIAAPTREHSRKPDEIHEAIEAAWPDLPKLEMFARETRPGWTAWGNETTRFNAGQEVA